MHIVLFEWPLGSLICVYLKAFVLEIIEKLMEIRSYNQVILLNCSLIYEARLLSWLLTVVIYSLSKW